MRIWNFLKNNCIYILWAIIYITLTWLLTGFHAEALPYILFIYGICITVALSPLGELILKYSEGVRKPATTQEREYLTDLYREVYANAKEKYPKLSNRLEIHIIDAGYVNAFAMGSNTIAVTRGAMDTFDEDELCGVIAHEIGHIKNGDTKALLISVVGNGLFTIVIMIARIIMHIIAVIASLFDNGNPVTFVLNIVIFLGRLMFDLANLVFVHLSQIILSINSQSNEYMADKFAHEIGYGAELTQALYLLQKIAIPTNIPLLERLKASHPNLAKRIASLEKLQQQEAENEYI